MNFEQANGKTIKESFDEFDQKNPLVYELFKTQVHRAIRIKKKNKISAKQILGYLRWEVFLRTDAPTGFKINDAYTAHYARKFIDDLPQFRNIFEFRRIRAGDPRGYTRMPVKNFVTKNGQTGFAFQ